MTALAITTTSLPGAIPGFARCVQTAQAHQIKRSKTTKGKQRQIKKWFDLVREAFQGSGYNATGDK